jgi:hypothetical protein
MKYLIAIAEYTVVILGTIYGMQWAANIALLTLWILPAVTVPLIFLCWAVVIFADIPADKLADFQEKTKWKWHYWIFRVGTVAEVALLAAYGWMWTAGYTLIAALITWGIVGSLRIAIKEKTALPAK